jgi:hypothetical protein
VRLNEAVVVLLKHRKLDQLPILEGSYGG